jgi:hypothetical protein
MRGKTARSCKTRRMIRRTLRPFEASRSRRRVEPRLFFLAFPSCSFVFPVAGAESVPFPFVAHPVAPIR